MELKIELMEKYLGNSTDAKIFKIMLWDVAKYVEADNKVLDIASDKEPRFSSLMARRFPDSTFTHFKDDIIRTKKIHPKYSQIKNLNIIYSRRNLNPPYDLAIAFFTLHELAKPEKNLKKIHKILAPNGKVIIVDYNLNWFLNLAKEKNWNAKTTKENFSKYVFNEGNERKVFREEVDCIKHHSKRELENFIGTPESNEDGSLIRKKVGLRDLLYKSYSIKTPWGERPKIFLYLGEKL